MANYVINETDKDILRETAKRQLELSQMECNKKRIKEWYLHNDLKGDRPMIHLEAGTFANELIPHRLRCSGSYARSVETTLYSNFINQELFDDDRVTPDYYALTYDTYFKLFDIDIHTEHTTGTDGNQSLGHHFVSYIEDLEEDFEKLKPSTYGVNKESTLEKFNLLHDTFGDILPIRLQSDCLYSVPTQMVVHFMSMENMMINMYDYPDLFKEMMNKIADDTLAYYRYLEEQKVIFPTTAGESLGQGSYCYTSQLPGLDEYNRRPFTTKDVWGFMDSQETVGISPAMFEEFIFPCYNKIAANYGLLSYGCCEPTDPIWASCLSKLSNLRKISISPWCKEEYMGEQLRGSNIIFHRKPSPNYLGIGTTLDEEALRAHLKKSLLAAKGCKMEITQRDVYTINNDIKKAKRYIDIIKEEIVKWW